MITLGIETSCDETASSVVENGRMLSSIVSSSVSLHEKFGGVIPEVASRFHIEYINRVAKKALKKGRKTLSDLDLIAVTENPGLPGSLIVGTSFAKALGRSLEIPVLSVDHLQAHLYANLLDRKNAKRIAFPFIGVVVSGGHTNIFVCHSLQEFDIIGRTKDDAIGEAFDKVAKILGIGYPGGPRIEKYARRFKLSLREKFSKKKPINFPRVYLEKDSFDFSLSGIKTAVLYHVKNKKTSKKDIPRICWSFQEAVFDVLVEKIILACRNFGIKQILLGGGVISNKVLRTKLDTVCGRLKYKLFYPPPALCVDNAAMVAELGEMMFKKGGVIDEKKKR